MAVSLDRKSLKSFIVLMTSFILHLLKAIIPNRKKDQAETFNEYFREDNITSFTPEEDEALFSFEACVNCGICPAHCRVSALSRGKFLGPEHMAVCASRSQPEFFADSASIFRCAVCSQCEPACPELVPVSRIAIHMRSMIRRTRADMLPDAYLTAGENLEKFGNIYGEAKVEKLPRNSGAEYILFLGCRERYHPERAKTLIDLMEKLGISVTGVEEVCCGGVPETMAVEYESDLVEKLLAAGPEKLIAVCPHCTDKLRSIEELSGKIEVSNIIEALHQKMPEGLKSSDVQGPVAFHDPCHLARGCNIIEEPRKILESLGLEVVEMNTYGLESPCCGAGGGLELVDSDLALDVARARIADAQAAGAKTLATECLGCYHILKKAAQAEGGVRVVLTTDLAAGSLKV